MSALPPIATAKANFRKGLYPLYPKSGHVQCSSVCPLWAKSGHSVLFDHLVGALLNRQRDKNVKRPGGFEIDDQLELDQGLDRELIRLGALENSIGVSSGAAVVVEQVAAIGHKAADFGEHSERIDGRDTIARRKRRDLNAICDQKNVRRHDKATVGLVCQPVEHRLDCGFVSNRRTDDLYSERC